MNIYGSEFLRSLVRRFFLTRPKARKVLQWLLYPHKTGYFRLLAEDVFIDTQEEIGYFRAARIQRSNIVFMGELPVLLSLLALASDDCTFVDVGANVGLWSSHFARLKALYPHLKVIAFEPNAGTFARLSKTMAPFDNATLHNTAISDRARELDFVSGPVSNVFGVKSNPYQYNDNVTTKVSARPLADFIGDAASIILKIDVEGHEYEVLLGCRDALGAGKIKAVFIDGYPKARHADICGLLTASGFKLLNGYRLTPYGDDQTEPLLAILSGARGAGSGATSTTTDQKSGS